MQEPEYKVYCSAHFQKRKAYLMYLLRLLFKELKNFIKPFGVPSASSKYLSNRLR